MSIVRVEELGVADAAAIAAEVLRSGGIVLYPTDTLYGLAADALNKEAVARLIALKGRDARKSISVVVRDTGMLAAYADFPSEAKRLADAHFPGPLTLVLRAHGSELAHLAPDATIGVRIPDDPFTHALSAAYASPYTATSANVSGEVTQATVAEVLEQFGKAAEDIALAIDDGPRDSAIPSTIVRVTQGNAEILREGALSRRDLGL